MVTKINACLLTAVLAVFALPAGAKDKKKALDPAVYYPECTQRNSTLSEAECESRLNVASPAWIPLPECKNLYGQEYRSCAVRVPHKIALEVRPSSLPSVKYLIAPNEAAKKTQADAVALGRVATLNEIELAYRGAEQAEKDAVKSGRLDLVNPDRVANVRAAISADELAASRVNCPEIKIGTTEVIVYRCMGQPDHVNSDLRVDQLVYRDGTFVYIDRQTGLVEDMQWRSQ